MLEVSDDLTKWATRAGYGITAEDESGALVFWTDPGGELRYYIRPSDEWSMLTFASRGSNEQFELAAASLSILERYLYSLFGADIRQQSGLKRLRIGTTREFLRDQYSLSELDAEGYRTLNHRGAPLARASDPVSSVSKLTKLSQLLTDTVEQIQASYLAEDGAPLFHV